MEEKTNGGPAFPVPLNPGESYSGHGPSDGMTLRDYFAAKAMQGIIGGATGWSHCGYTPIDGLSPIENDARLAYQYADAMIKARGEE
ncbi:MAG: hypothetical protein H5U29_00095 [Pusillimonas sp.]|nr:hypothetical protein [Pusillimonas sp.]